MFLPIRISLSIIVSEPKLLAEQLLHQPGLESPQRRLLGRQRRKFGVHWALLHKSDWIPSVNPVC